MNLLALSLPRRVWAPYVDGPGELASPRDYADAGSLGPMLGPSRWSNGRRTRTPGKCGLLPQEPQGRRQGGGGMGGGDKGRGIRRAAEPEAPRRALVAVVVPLLASLVSASKQAT